MLAIILSACPSFLAHAACPLSRSRRPISQSAHPACCRMSEGATPSSELRVESFAPLVSPGQARKGVSFERRIARLRALCEQHGHALPTAEHGSDLVRWASRQRTLYRQGSLAEAVIEEPHPLAVQALARLVLGSRVEADDADEGLDVLAQAAEESQFGTPNDELDELLTKLSDKIRTKVLTFL